jgi:hypothetical protein
VLDTRDGFFILNDTLSHVIWWKRKTYRVDSLRKAKGGLGLMSNLLTEYLKKN